MRVTRGRREGAAPCVLSGLYFYNQRTGERGRRPSLSFLNRRHASVISFSSRLGRGIFLSLHGQARSTNYCFHACREHVLGIINLLSSLSRMWGLHHHCFIVWGARLLHSCAVIQACLVLWLSKPVLLHNHQLTGVSHNFFYL